MSIHLAFYKPFEVLSQFTDVIGRRTLSDFIFLPDIYPAGRLDYRSEGLLIITDDGEMIKLLTSPRFAHDKTYYVQVEGEIDSTAIDQLCNSIVLPGIQTRPVTAEIIGDPGLPPRPVPVRGYHPTSWVRITLSEGKKHQVRRMTAAVGFPTLRLVRVSIGPVLLGNLLPGQWRYLKHYEIQGIFSFKVKSNHGD
jgi:23S rRNA pseudouridine2457 synthase